MNLVDGKFLDSTECDAVLDNLEQRILDTLSKGRLEPETVITACNRLVTELDEDLYLQAMAALGIDEALGKSYIGEARQMFSEDNLRRRLRIELGENFGKAVTYTPPGKAHQVTEQTMPLGVLLHVVAGNVDGLPAFSVLEGLLTGNINILKLPAEEGGISAALLLELIKIEPSLAGYIYVFDYSSKDIIHIEKLISAADAIAVWGGDEAVTALRSLAGANTKLIEWGHKVSFAYVTERGITENALAGLARNIIETGQLMCSSCQGIFVDTEDMEEVYSFCGRFLPVLDGVHRELSRDMGIGVRSQTALRVYNEELESIYKNSRVWRGENCSLTAYPDKTLEPAIGFGNAWVKPLPKKDLLTALRPYKNYLQTVGLLCGGDERAELTDILWKTGVVRACPGEHMSAAYSGAPHDGEYPLRRYTKVVSTG